MVLSGSSRMDFTSFMFLLMSSKESRTSFEGRGISIILPTVTRARPIILLIIENMRSRYQLDTSGKLRSLKVSPVGAVSRTTTSYSPDLLKVFR